MDEIQEATPATDTVQKRGAVRARVRLPVAVSCQGARLDGETVDLSEAGMRATTDRWGLPPEPGTAVDVTVDVDGAPVTVPAGVVSLEERRGRWLLTVQFDDMPERDQDSLRRRVFQALREERAREC